MYGFIYKHSLGTCELYIHSTCLDRNTCKCVRLCVFLLVDRRNPNFPHAPSETRSEIKGRKLTGHEPDTEWQPHAH